MQANYRDRGAKVATVTVVQPNGGTYIHSDSDGYYDTYSNTNSDTNTHEHSNSDTHSCPHSCAALGFIFS